MNNKFTYLMCLSILVSIAMATPAVLGASTQSQTVTATLDNTNPIAKDVSTDSASYNPTASSTTAVTITFDFYDGDGYQNIDNSSLKCNVTFSSPTYGADKVNQACGTPTGVDENTTQCTAVVNMDYYDDTGTWTVTCFGEDYSAATDSNSTTFTYNSLKAWTINQGTVGFGTFTLVDSASFPDNIIMTNTGNLNQTEVNVTAYDLQGQTTTTEFMLVTTTSFRTSIATTWGSADGLVNATAVTVTGGTLDVFGSPLGATETVYFGLDPTDLTPSLSAQDYQNPAGQEWVIST